MRHSNTPASLTLFNSDKPLTKRFYRAQDGLAYKFDGFSHGEARRIDVSSASELAYVIERLSPTQCLAYGVTERLSASIGTQKHLRPGQISRTRDNFAWADAAGVLFLDFDGKFSAGDVPDLRDAIQTAVPELADAPQVWTRSSSNGIHDPQTGDTTRGGLHCYVLLDHACEVTRIGQHLYDALWLNGHGFHALSKGDHPAALERCLIDASVWQPERLDFAAAPVLDDGLERHGSTVIEVCNDDAPALVTRRIKPLCEDQQAQAERLKRESRESIKPAIVTERQAKLDALPPKQREERRRQYVAADRGTLAPSAVLHFSDGSTATAGHVLANLDAFKGRRLADPLEPGYGNDARIAMVTDTGRIFSHAHGGQSFRILDTDADIPADVVALDPVASDKAIVSACYRLRMDAKATALASVCEETGADEAHVLYVWREHLASKAKPLHRDGSTKHVGTFAEARGMVDAGMSSLFLAKLGSGKTEQLGRHAMMKASRGMAVTVLRSLTHSHAEKFGAVHYSDAPEIRNGAPRVATTVHSLLDKQDTQGIDVLVLDEFAAIADLLTDTRHHRILDERKQAQALELLRDASQRGVQIVALDGDLTPTAAWLARELGLMPVEVAEMPWPEPAVDLVAQEANAGTPYHAHISQLLADGEKVVIATDSKGEAKKLAGVFKSYRPLLLHGDNTGEAEQAAFLADPEGEAKRHRLVIYTPTLGVGVSVVATQPHMFVIQAAGTLNGAGMWQLARRYRRPAGGLIQWSVAQHLCRPIRSGITEHEAAADIRAHAKSLGMFDGTVGGVIASNRQTILHESNPLHRAIGHLLNLGVLGSVNVRVEAEAVVETRIEKENIAVQEVERVASAPKCSEDEARHLPRTEEGQATRSRHGIEQGLCLTSGEFCAEDGSLSRALVAQCLNDRLVSRTRRHASLMARAKGADLERGSDAPEGFAYMRHANRQADIMLAIVRDLTDGKGRIALTAEKAEDIANAYRAQIHVAYRDIPKARRKAARAHYSRWLRDLLEAWGYSVEHKARTDTGNRFLYATATDVRPHADRVSSMYLLKSADTKNRLEAAS